MSKADKKEKKAAKKAAKAEKRANRNPEVVKTVVSAVTALICVVAVVFTSLSITDKICKTNVEIAEKTPVNSGSQSSNGDNVNQNGGDDNNVSNGDDTQNGGDDNNVSNGDDTQNGGDDNSSASNGDNNTSNGGSNNGSSSNGGNNTQTPSAPVGNDIAKIVSYYNTAANATKAYKGTMNIKVVQGTVTKITETSFPNAAISIANGMLPNDYPTNKSFTVTNGNGVGKNETKGENETRSINKILPIDDNSKMSNLTAAGVQSATCTKVSGGYKVVIKLKTETINSLSARPKSHTACMGVMELTDDDLKPFTVENCTIKYPGGTLTAVVNDKNLLSEFDSNNPIHLNGTLKWTVIKGTAVIEANYRQNFKFTY